MKIFFSKSHKKRKPSLTEKINFENFAEGIAIFREMCYNYSKMWF